MLLVVASLTLVALLFIQMRSTAHQPTPTYSLDDAAFRAFPTYRPSPTPIPGLHDYAVPLRPAPTASPLPVQSARKHNKATSAAGGQRATGSGSHYIRRDDEIMGKASWHATGRSGYYAAACRPLRQAIGSTWRGRHVLVSVGRRAIEVKLNDYCASTDKTIDLSDEVFRYFAPLSRGVIKVTVGW